MKLRDKLLTALPVCVIGLSAPIAVSSCSCNKSSLSFNFGDGINCKDKNTSNPKYHTFKEIKAAVKNNIETEPSGAVAKPVSWNDNQSKNQVFYWDLINSCAWQSIPFVMTGNWKESSNFQLHFNDDVFTSLEYGNYEGGKAVLIYGVNTSGKKLIVGSYRYQFVKYE